MTPASDLDNGLPSLFVSRLKEIFPPQVFESCLASFHKERAVSFRVNTLKGEIDSVISELKSDGVDVTALDWAPNAFAVPPQQRQLLTQSGAAEEGLIYVQSLSSMLPPLLLSPQAEERILDIAAAPGSKTLQMAAMMEDRGWISAVEIVKSRFYRLKDNIQRQGASIVHTYLMDGARVWKKCPEQFDRVLVDAPCSSESRISALDPATFQYWGEKKIKEQSKKQGKLLFSAIQSLKPGGELVYSTCSFAPEENETTVHKALKTFGDAIEILPIELPFQGWQPGLKKWRKKTFAEEVEMCRRILPNEQMEGFFLCRMRKKRSTIKSR